MTAPETFGQRLRRVRELSGLTVARLAAKAGVWHGTVKDQERKRDATLRGDTVLKLARALHVSTDVLLDHKAPVAPLPLLSSDEAHLLRLFRSLKWSHRDLVLSTVHHLRRQREGDGS